MRVELQNFKRAFATHATLNDSGPIPMISPGADERHRKLDGFHLMTFQHLAVSLGRSTWAHLEAANAIADLVGEFPIDARRPFTSWRQRSLAIRLVAER